MRRVTMVINNITMDFIITVALRPEENVHIFFHGWKGGQSFTVPGFPNSPGVAGQVGNDILQDFLQVFIHLKF